MSEKNAKAKIKKCKNKKDQYEFIDQDYLDKLSPEDQAYLADFIEEYYEGKGSKRHARRQDIYSQATRKQQNLDNVQVAPTYTAPDKPEK